MSDFKISNESCQFKPKISTNLRDLSFICWQVWVSIDFFFFNGIAIAHFALVSVKEIKTLMHYIFGKRMFKSRLVLIFFFRVSSKCYLITHFCTKRLVVYRSKSLLIIISYYNILCHSLNRTLTIIWNADPVHNLVIFTCTIFFFRY